VPGFELNTLVTELSGKKLYSTGHIYVEDEHNSFLNEEHRLYLPNIILVMKWSEIGRARSTYGK